MLFDNIYIMGYILKMVKYISQNSYHDSYLIVYLCNAHPLPYSGNNASVGSDPLK